jgi:hypothetical protein
MQRASWNFFLKKKLHVLSPRANYTDRTTASCRRSDCQRLRIEGATLSAWRIPTAIFSVFIQEPLLFYQLAPQLYSRGWVDPVPDPLFFFLVVPRIEHETPDLYPRTLTTRPQRRSQFLFTTVNSCTSAVIMLNALQWSRVASGMETLVLVVNFDVPQQESHCTRLCLVTCLFLAMSSVTVLRNIIISWLILTFK